MTKRFDDRLSLERARHEHKKKQNYKPSPKGRKLVPWNKKINLEARRQLWRRLPDEQLSNWKTGTHRRAWQTVAVCRPTVRTPDLPVAVQAQKPVLGRAQTPPLDALPLLQQRSTRHVVCRWLKQRKQQIVCETEYINKIYISVYADPNKNTYLCRSGSCHFSAKSWLRKDETHLPQRHFGPPLPTIPSTAARVYL